MIEKYLTEKLACVRECFSEIEWEEHVEIVIPILFVIGFALFVAGLIIGLFNAPLPVYVLCGIGTALALPGIVLDYLEFRQRNSNNN